MYAFQRPWAPRTMVASTSAVLLFIEGNQVVCTAFRIGYNLDEVVWDYVGACAPINLKSRIAGDHLAIQRSWLEKGERFF